MLNKTFQDQDQAKQRLV